MRVCKYMHIYMYVAVWVPAQVVAPAACLGVAAAMFRGPISHMGLAGVGGAQASLTAKNSGAPRAATVLGPLACLATWVCNRAPLRAF